MYIEKYDEKKNPENKKYETATSVFKLDLCRDVCCMWCNAKRVRSVTAGSQLIKVLFLIITSSFSTIPPQFGSL